MTAEKIRPCFANFPLLKIFYLILKYLGQNVFFPSLKWYNPIMGSQIMLTNCNKSILNIKHNQSCHHSRRLKRKHFFQFNFKVMKQSLRWVYMKWFITALWMGTFLKELHSILISILEWVELLEMASCCFFICHITTVVAGWNIKPFIRFYCGTFAISLCLGIVVSHNF